MLRNNNSVCVFTKQWPELETEMSKADAQRILAVLTSSIFSATEKRSADLVFGRESQATVMIW